MPFTQEALLAKLENQAKNGTNWSYNPHLNSSYTVPGFNNPRNLLDIPDAHLPKQGIWSWLSDQAANSTEQAKGIIANAINPDADPAPAGSYTRHNITYQDADLAAAYGMNAATAYQEALANTAHQREVADLRAAGLNPVLSATQGHGAGTVSSADVLASPGGASSADAFKDTLGRVKDVLQLVKLAKSVF